jgi:hypothetical protein
MVPANGFRVRPAVLRVWLSVWFDAHWFRTAGQEGDPDYLPCAYRECGRPGYEHWTWSGEWMMTRRERWAASLNRAVMVWKAR